MIFLKLAILIIFGFIFLFPLYLYTSSWDKYNFNEEYIKSGFNYDRSIDPFKTLPVLQFNNTEEDIDEFTGCGRTGVYIGSVDVFYDCKGRCKSDDYEYIFLDKNTNIIVNNKRLSGAYCLPKSFTRCNLNTSFAVVGLNDYQCITKFPTLLGGSSGNEIIGCSSGRLFDGLLKKEYVHYIPNNLFIENEDERLVDSSFRFSCVDDSKYKMVDLPKTVASRFETSIDPCGILGTGSFNFSRNECDCSQLTASGICTDCKSGYGYGDSYTTHGANYAVSIGRDCVDPSKATHVETRFVTVPCGVDSIEKNSKCERGQLNISSSYSPMALENMFG